MKLKEYLKLNDLSVLEFSRQSRINLSGLYDYVAGRKIPSYETAKAIQIMTEGKVTIKDLRREPCRKNTSRPRKQQPTVTSADKEST